MPDLLDTNVISELRKARPNPEVVAYLAGHAIGSFYLSSVTLAEIRYGIFTEPQEQRKRLLEAWLEDEVLTIFSGRIIQITESVLLRWRVLMEIGRKSGRTFAQPDLLLAATALEHNLTLVTRNTRDFTGIPGLVLLNPWEQTR